MADARFYAAAEAQGLGGLCSAWRVGCLAHTKTRRGGRIKGYQVTHSARSAAARCGRLSGAERAQLRPDVAACLAFRLASNSATMRSSSGPAPTASSSCSGGEAREAAGALGSTRCSLQLASAAAGTRGCCVALAMHGPTRPAQPAGPHLGSQEHAKGHAAVLLTVVQLVGHLRGRQGWVGLGWVGAGRLAFWARKGAAQHGWVQPWPSASCKQACMPGPPTAGPSRLAVSHNESSVGVATMRCMAGTRVLPPSSLKPLCKQAQWRHLPPTPRLTTMRFMAGRSAMGPTGKRRCTRPSCTNLGGTGGVG